MQRLDAEAIVMLAARAGYLVIALSFSSSLLACGAHDDHPPVSESSGTTPSPSGATEGTGSGAGGGTGASAPGDASDNGTESDAAASSDADTSGAGTDAGGGPFVGPGPTTTDGG